MESLRFAADSGRKDENQKDQANLKHLLHHCGHGDLSLFDRSARDLEVPRWRAHERSVPGQRCIPTLLAASVDRGRTFHYEANRPNYCAL
ncbi:hypothetical protein D3C71_405170 [compost metagenome]